MDNGRKIIAWAVLAILYPLSSILGQVPWPDGATAHYQVEVSGDRPTNEVSHVAGVRFFSGGSLPANSPNVRVTDAKGTALPIEIIYTHPLNASLVLFPLQAGEETYHLFFGGSVTSGAALTNFNRGLFYETRQRPDADSSTWDSIRKLWTGAANSMGVAVLEDMQTRCNPFDETDNQFASRTWGALRFPREDVYKFGVFAKDQGFFSINGVPVASTTLDATAKTTPIADALVPGGVQTVELLQARMSGVAVTGVSWLIPWPEYYYANLSAKPITPAWHPGIVQGLAREFTVRNLPFWANFNDFQTDLLLGAEQPVVLVRFHNRTGGKTDGVTYQWDFGDGATSAEANPSHVYVKPGRYTVTLTAGGSSKFQKAVLASSFSAVPAQKAPINSSINPFAAEETIRLVTPWLDKYEAGTVWTLIAIAEQMPDRKARAETVLKLGPLYLAKAGANIPTTVEIPVRQKLAAAKFDLGQIDAGIAEMQQLLPKLEKQRAQRTKVQLEIGKMYQRAARSAQALELFGQIVKDKGGDDPKMERAAQIAIGETYLQQADLANARKAFEQSAQIEVGDGRTEREKAIRRGSLYSTLRQAVNEHAKLALEPSYGSEVISRDALLTLLERARNSFDSLAFEFPDARLNPDVVYHHASLLLAENDPEACLLELKTLAKAEPTGRYVLRMTMLESRVAFVKKDYDKASSLVEAVLKTTKEEDIVKEATKLQALIKDAIQSRAQFTDAPKRFWPNLLLADASFEKAEVVSNAVANLEFTTPSDPAKAQTAKFSIVDGFGTSGRRCVMIELPVAVAPPVYVVVRFPTAIGDRVFARCNVLSTDVDFRWAEFRRTTTQGEGLHGSINSTFLSLQQWGWISNVVNTEPWRTFAWRSSPATSGEPKGYMMFVGLAREGRKIIPAGTRIYVDAAEAYLAP